MRRLIAVLSSVAVLAALLPLLAGSATAQTLSVQITPANEANTAVRWAQAVRVSGQAPAGALVSDVRAQALDGATVVQEQTFLPGVRNRSEQQAGGGDFIHVDDQGTLRGRLTLGCIFDHPRRCGLKDAWVTDARVEVTLQGGTTQHSEALRVDFTPPVVSGYELVAENRIRVWFSEPVRHRASDDIQDWEVTDPDARVMRIEGPVEGDCEGTDWPEGWQPRTGCTRTLVITPVDEDATPQVRHRLAQTADYEDYTSNILTRDSTWGGGAATSRALDLVRPALPSIDAVDGQPHLTSSSFDGDTRTPTIQVSNLRLGHSVYFRWAGSEGTEGSSEPEEVSGLLHSTTLPELGEDDEFSIQAVAVDIHGNESIADLNGPTLRPDSSRHTIRYVLEQLPVQWPAIFIDDPNATRYTTEATATIAGHVRPAQSGLGIEVRDIDTGLTAARTETAAQGIWKTQVDLPIDRRYRFQVRAVSGDQAGPWVWVSPIIRDRVAPILQVIEPSVGLGSLLGGGADPRPRYAAGDGVDITWLAADPAPLDLENPDHGSHVDIDVLFGGGARSEVVRGLDYTLLTQTHAYTVRNDDVSGALREAWFEVTVTDLAGNSTTRQSLPIAIDGTVLGYEPWFVQNDPNESVIETRFDAPLQGVTTPADWRIDGNPPRTVQHRMQGGRSVVLLVASQSITDPNARPSVQFRPAPLNPDPLRGQDDRSIRTGVGPAFDGIPPALSIALPDPGPRSAQVVTVSGQTDQTQWPNTLRAFRDGRVIAQGEAGSDGRFTLDVPLDPDRLNQVEVKAVDPAGNVSPTRPFEVIEDSTPPVVVIDHPLGNSTIPRNLPIRWTTIDNNPDVVDVEYRVGTGNWQSLASEIPDQGLLRWHIPSSVPDDAVVALRVTATDRAGHRGEPAVVRTLSLKPPLLAACEDVDPAPFTDRDRVPDVHQFAVDCLYALDIAKGSERGGQLWFDPQTDISRAQFSGFLHRSLEHAAIGLPGPADRFADVPEGHTFDADIHELTAAAIILGYDEQRFGPRDPIKRDQTAALLLRALEYAREDDILPESGSYFADTASSAHVASIDAAYEQGLVVGRTPPSGGTPGIYDPGALTTRAQMATVLVRALGQFDR